MSEDSTAKEIAQNQVNLDTAEKLGEISSDVKSVLKSQEVLFKIYNDHEKRITDSERTLAGIKVKIGFAGAVIGAIFSIAGNWFWKKITGH